MSAAVEDLALHIENNTALTRGTDLFINFMPDSPDVVTSLYSSSGDSETGQFFGSGTLETFEVVRIEVITRAGDHDFPTARSNAEAIRAAIATVANETIDGTLYLRVATNETFDLDGYDVQDRIYLRGTFEVHKYL